MLLKLHENGYVERKMAKVMALDPVYVFVFVNSFLLQSKKKENKFIGRN